MTAERGPLPLALAVASRTIISLPGAGACARTRHISLTKADDSLNTRHPLRRAASDRGGVAERLKAADCKSALFGVRWFESSPLHQSLGSMGREAWGGGMMGLGGRHGVLGRV
jgi:hypothetical protein